MPLKWRNVISSDVTFRGALTSHAGMITSPHSKYTISGYQPGQADNLRRETSVSHMQNSGYRVKNGSNFKYVIIRDYHMAIFISYPVST